MSSGRARDTSRLLSTPLSVGGATGTATGTLPQRPVQHHRGEARTGAEVRSSSRPGADVRSSHRPGQAPAQPRALPRRRDLRAAHAAGAGLDWLDAAPGTPSTERAGRTQLRPEPRAIYAETPLDQPQWSAGSLASPYHSDDAPTTVLRRSTASGSPATPGAGVPAAYPRRRDLRRQGMPPVTGPLPVVGTDPSGLTVPVPRPGASFEAGPAQLGYAIAADPRSRRDSRQEVPAERSGSLAVGVARAAVVTMLVGVGYAAVSGHHLEVGSLGEGDPSGTDSAASDAMMAAAPRASTSLQSDWDVRSELDALKVANQKQQAVRAAAARAAAARVAAAKAAAAQRAAALATATREANRNPKAVARILAAQRGWTGQQFTCLDKLWTRESNWNPHARNPSSGAYGIPQALPGSKMGSVASDWRTNAVTQIKWGLEYIDDRYGTPCGAWAHSQATGWY